MFSALDGVTKEQKLLLYACIREPNGVLTDLKPLPVPALVNVEGPLLRAFLTGYRLVKGSLATQPLERPNALICLHDWLRLFREIIRQPPPLGLLKIEQTLRERRDLLNRLHPQTAPQRDKHTTK